jgi:hypothetical protein
MPHRNNKKEQLYQEIMATTSAPAEATPIETIAASGSLSSIHAVYEDPFRPNKWTTQYPARVDPPVEDAKSAQHALVARYKLSDNPSKSLDLHSIIVQSPLLKQSLAKVLAGYPGITTELERLEFKAPFECFVHRWEQLCAERDEMVRKAQTGVLGGEGNWYAQTVTHLKLLCSTLEEELGPVIREKKDLISHGVMTFKQMWTLFEPGCLVYCKSDGEDCIFKVKTAKTTTSNSRQVYQLECQYVDFDGTAFGYNKGNIEIGDFRGTKEIAKFEAYVVSGGVKTVKPWQLQYAPLRAKTTLDMLSERYRCLLFHNSTLLYPDRRTTFG